VAQKPVGAEELRDVVRRLAIAAGLLRGAVRTLVFYSYDPNVRAALEAVEDALLSLGTALDAVEDAKSTLERVWKGDQ